MRTRKRGQGDGRSSQRGGVFHGMLRFSGAFGTLPMVRSKYLPTVYSAQKSRENRATTRAPPPSRFSSVTPPPCFSHMSDAMFSQAEMLCRGTSLKKGAQPRSSAAFESPARRLPP